MDPRPSFAGGVILGLVWIFNPVLSATPNDNCIYGGGSCSDSDDGTTGLKTRTAWLLSIFIFIGFLATILVLCCFIKRCPLFGDCERSRGLRKPR